MIEIKFDITNNRALAYDEEKMIGLCEFIQEENNWNIVHTEVDSKYQGRGIARKLVECILENAKKQNKNIIANCSYARKIIEK